MYISLAILGLIGFAIAFYLYEANKHHKKVVCPLGHNCTAVVRSQFGHLFYIRNEIWGMVGYVLIFFSAILAEVTTGALQYAFDTIILLVVVPSALFAVILTYAQFVILKKYCFWCMVANLINFIMFIIII